MAKSAQQRLNEFWSESELTRNAAKNFTQAAFDKYKSNSYAAGYFESLVADLIMQMPKAKRDEYRTQLIRAAQNVEGQ